MLTAHQVAAQLGLSAQEVYRLVNQGAITYYRFGRAIRFDQKDVYAYIKATERRPPTARVLREYMKLRARAVAAGFHDAMPELSPNQVAIATTRYRRMRLAPWADGKAIRMLYAEAKRLSKETGIKHEVDHIIPLMGEYVSGLHVETNLRIITKAQNMAKRNKVDEC